MGETETKLSQDLNNEWSTYAQNPEFLASTRAFTLKPEYLELTRKWLGMKDGMKVLDVGCGTGECTCYIAKGVKNCEFYGIDMDDAFIEYARNREFDNQNTFEFIKGDALKLPFPDRTFDLVVSHTFLTNIGEPLKALREMKRVAKKGAVVSSVTAQTLTNIPMHMGVYPNSHSYYNRYMQLETKVVGACEKIKPLFGFLNDIKPENIPQYFVKAGFWNICMNSTPNLICLSSADISKEVKQQYIEHEYLSKVHKAKAFSELEGFFDEVPKGEFIEYLELLEERKQVRLQDINENSIFEWIGGATLVMTGVVPIF